MPYPFTQKHSEKQYLDLETNYLNLFNALYSAGVPHRIMPQTMNVAVIWGEV